VSQVDDLKFDINVKFKQKIYAAAQHCAKKKVWQGRRAGHAYVKFKCLRVRVAAMQADGLATSFSTSPVITTDIHQPIPASRIHGYIKGSSATL